MNCAHRLMGLKSHPVWGTECGHRPPTSMQIKIKMRTILYLIVMLALTGIFSAFAEEVTIPDPGLNAAIRETLNKPTGPLTQQDLLALTLLNAHDRNIGSVEGLEAA